MTHPFSDAPLPFGKLIDGGFRNYTEFACSRETFAWLYGGAMRSIDGQPVALRVAEECVGGHNVIVQARPQ